MAKGASGAAPMSSSSSRSRPDVEIRPLRAADAPSVSALASAAASTPGDNVYPIEHLDLELRGKSERPVSPDRAAFGAFLAGRLVATACATPEAGGRGYLSRVYVAPGLRGAGIGRAMIEHLEAFLKDRGSSVAYLRFFGARMPLQRLWIRAGYARVGTARVLSLSGSPGFVVTCTKRLL